MRSLGKSYINKHRGYYAVTDSKLDKELSRNVMEFLFAKSLEYISLFDNFTDLQRDYLINHVLQFLKEEHYNVTLEKDLPDLYLKVLILDITLNIRYMSMENFEIDWLQLSVNKYFAYKNKTDEKLAKKLTSSYTEYLQDTFLSHIDKENDPRFKILAAIVKKL